MEIDSESVMSVPLQDCSEPSRGKLSLGSATTQICDSLNHIAAHLLDHDYLASKTNSGPLISSVYCKNVVGAYTLLTIILYFYS